MVRQPSFDDKQTYYPLFFLADPPNEVGHHLTLSRPPPSTNAIQYLDALECHDPDGDWLAISSSAPSLTQLLSEIKSHLTELPSQPMPFLNSTVEEVYSFFNSYLRSPSDRNGFHHFTDFTFFVVDSECFSSPRSDYTILLCSDGPDFDESETETRLKIIELPVADALETAVPVELLQETPSEAGVAPPQDPNLDKIIVKVMPFPTFIPLEPYTNDEDQEYRIATPAEARSRKKEGLAAAMAAGWVLGKGTPDGRPIPHSQS